MSTARRREDLRQRIGASSLAPRAALAVTASLLATSALGQSVWNASPAGDWAVGANWTPAGVPTSATIVVIDNGGEAQITVAGAKAATVILGQSDGSSSGALTITAGGTLTTSTDSAIIGDAGTGIVTVSRLGSNWTHGGDLIIGSQSGADGTFTVDMSATALIGGSAILGNAAGASGSVSVDGQDSALTVSKNILVGNGGSGTLTLSSGGSVLTQGLTAGVLAGSDGTLRVTGAGSLLDVEGLLTIGAASDAGLRIEAAGEADSFAASIGSLAGGSGSVTLNGTGSTWANTGLLTIGGGGTGELVLEAGSTVETATAVVGDLDGGTGTVRVTGQGSKFTSSGLVTVGSAGSGAVTIEASGTLDADSLTLGASAGGTGSVQVTGETSTLAVTNALVIGDAGTGVVDINSAGVVTAASATLGVASGSSGEIDLSGLGSTLDVTGELVVGAAGDGTVSITLGGAATANSVSVGSEAGGSATLALTDDGSTLAVSGALTIGADGSGALTIANGAAVSATDAVAGAGADGDGSISVSNQGSSLALSGPLTLGAAGDGSLTIDAGGAASATDIVLGEASGSSGSARVNAAGSDLALSGSLTVGGAGTGRLDITAGATAEAATAVIGAAAGGEGAVAVDGLGSALAIAGDMTVGGAGSGTLTLSGLGTIEVGGGTGIITLASEAGSTGTLVIRDGGGSLLAGEVAGGAGTATLVFAESDDGFLFTPDITGTASLVQSGSGRTVLAGLSSYTGTTSVEAGTLAAGAEGAFSPSSDVAVAAAGTLDLAGYSQTVAGLANAGTVSLAGLAAGTVLNVAGNYQGGGILVLGTALGGDGSATDRLVVDGDVSGATRLKVVNLGGSGAQTSGSGIELVSIAGASPSDAFTLGRTIAGAYDYRLYQGGTGADAGDGNWYLRSDLSLAAQTYRAYPATLLAYGGASIGTLAERTGGWTVGAATTTIPGGAFVRGFGLAANASPDSGSPFSQDLGFAQTGIAEEIPISAPGLLTAGVTATFGRSRTTVDAATHGSAGTGEIASNAYGFGGTLTWWGNDGLYADAVGQLTYFDTDVSTSDAGTLAGGTSALGTALSVEIGKAFEAAPSWRVVPQAQLVYASVGYDNFTDSDGVTIGGSGGDSLVSRAGLRLEHSGFLDAIALDAMRYNAYVIANLYYAFVGNSEVTVGGTTLAQADNSLAGQFGLGGSLGMGSRTSLYGQASYTTAFGAGDAWSGSFGLRLQW